MSVTIGPLSNRTQAMLMFVALELPAVITWASAGMPTDRASVGLIMAYSCGAAVAFIKEILGGGPATPPTPPTFQPYQPPVMAIPSPQQAYTPPPTTTITTLTPTITQAPIVAPITISSFKNYNPITQTLGAN